MNLIFAQAATNAAGGAFLGLGFVIFALLIAYAVLWFYCIFTAATRTDFDGSQRVLWIVVLLFLHGLGPILYLLLTRRRA